MSPIWITFAIVAAVVVLFISNRIPVVIVALAVPLALYATGVLDLTKSLAGLGDTTVIFIASLFVVSAGLQTTGITTWAGQILIRHAGTSRVRLIVLMMLLVAALTALITVNGAVAALMPVVVVAAVRLGRPTSQLLMPLAFGSHAGSLLALTGTAVNVLVVEAAQKSGVTPFGYFEFALVGVPLLAGTIAIVVLFGERLLPNRNGANVPADLSRHASTLIEHYSLAQGLHQLRVQENSPHVGKARRGLQLGDYPGVSVFAVWSGSDGGPLVRPNVEAGDVLVLNGGDDATIARLAAETHLSAVERAPDVKDVLFNRAFGLAEVMVSPRSGLVGETVFPGMVSRSGDMVVLGVQRQGENQGPGGTMLAAGDVLLMRGTWDVLDQRAHTADIVVVDAPEMVRQQAVPLGAGATKAAAVLVVMVALLATGVLPSVIVALVCACAMVLLGVVRVEQAYHAIDWTTVILIGAMTPLSTAMTETGAAQMLADGLIRLVGDAGPYALLAGLFALTAILGQLISNMATALIVIPIALATAKDMDISARPVLMSVTVAAAAAFLTPVATPMNLMIMGPGGYRFGDYWRLGLPLILWFFVVATFIVPIFWSFH